MIIKQGSIGLFEGLSSVTEIIGLTNLDTSDAVFMGQMFSGMENITSLDLSSFDTSNVMGDSTYPQFGMGACSLILLNLKV